MHVPHNLPHLWAFSSQDVAKMVTCNLNKVIATLHVLVSDTGLAMLLSI